MTPKLDYVPDPIWDIPSWIWEMINLGHGSSQIEIPVWDDRNRTSDLGYPKFDLGHGRVWSTTVIKKCGDSKLKRSAKAVIKKYESVY